MKRGLKRVFGLGGRFDRDLVGRTAPMKRGLKQDRLPAIRAHGIPVGRIAPMKRGLKNINGAVDRHQNSGSEGLPR